ncbi:MAG: protein kinase [Gemmatimonadales bacterium]
MAEPFERLKAALADRYTIEGELGEGGMATVYLAHDLKHDRQVALKILRPELVAVIGTTRFLHEIRVTANLHHPHIVQLYDSGEADGVLYYVMPCVEGESLREKLNRENQLSVEDAVAIARSVADALDYAHRRNVIHRDIKPENIMLQEGTPLVADFGIALAISTVAGDRITETGLSLGTPSYMSPEQATGDRELSARSDVYALGCVLYEMLAGDPPFSGSNVQAVIAKVLVEKPLGLRAIRDTVPLHIEQAVEKALAKVPADRFGSAKDFAEALTSTSTIALPAERPRAPSVPGVRWWRALAYAAPAGAAALLVWALLARGGDSSPRDVAGSTIRRLTSFAGWEMGPSWSPDGNMVAYTHIVAGNADIATLSLGGGDPHVLTAEPTDETNPRWSPDGSKIAFLSDRGSGTNVYWIPPTGGAERKLVETNIPFLDNPWDWFGALGATPWSPDGQELLFSRLHQTGEVALWKMNLSTREQTRLTTPPRGASDLFGSWSFDGESIVFTRTQIEGNTLWLLPAEGGDASLLLGDEYVNAMGAWFPNNRRLAFLSTRGGAMNIWGIELGTGNLHQLTIGAAGNDAQPVVARNGTIAYSNYDHQVDIYRMRPDAPDEDHERLTEFTGDYFGARISPDGDRVLYSSTREGLFDLWLLDRTTGQHRKLTEHPANDRLPDWSPDGQEIVFLSDRDGAVKLWVFEMESGVARQLTDHVLPWSMHPAEAGGPRWSPDGSAIGYIAPTEEGNAIWLVEPDGTNPHPSTVRNAFSFGWYRDGQRVLYARRAPDGSGLVELRAAHLGTGEDVLLRSGAIAELEVSPDGSALSFVESVSHFTMNLQVVQLALRAGPNALPRLVGEPRQVTFGGGIWHVHNGGWAPDGSALVYSRDRDFGDIYVIEPKR